MNAWREFHLGKWCDDINVRNFIQENYTPYDGDSSFLEGATQRTKEVLAEVTDLLKRETANNGVLSVDPGRISSILTFDPGYINKDKDIIVGLQTDEPLKRAINPFAGKRMAEKACEAYGYKMSDEVQHAFKYRTTHNDGVFATYSDEMRAARNAGLITGLPDAYGRGRIIGDYRRLALYGMDKLIKEKDIDKHKLGRMEMNEENIRLLEEVAKQITFMVQLKIMASQYGHDISVPAKNFKEAVQWLYYAYLGAVKEQNGAANSIGRITTFLDIYAERDLAEGVLTEIDAQEIMDDLVLKLRLVRHLRTPEYNELFAGDPTWVTMAEGGIGEDGRNMVTKSAFRILNTLYTLGSSAEPNITILWSERLPKGYKDFCAKVSIDTDSIQYENDDLMRSDFGDDYGIACCVSAMRIGKQMQYFGARCNMAKILLMSMNGGRDEVSGRQIGEVSTIYDETVLNYDEVIKGFTTSVAWLAKLYVNTMNIIHFMHDKYAYERLMMSFHDTQVGRLMAFGISGLSVVADSLSAIKYAKVTPVKGESGLIEDFKVEGDFPKYGNDDDRVDNIAKWLIELFYSELKKNKTYRNAKHTLSILTITSNVVYGKATGATPDGRGAGEPFAPGANPMHGRDSEGALASLNSVAKLKFAHCQDGISNTFSISTNTLGTNEKERIATLTGVLDGYFKQNAHHINVNVLNRETLIDAMDHPEKYPNLTIRVSGYAVNFNKLSKNQQKEVIARTFHDKL